MSFGVTFPPAIASTIKVSIPGSGMRVVSTIRSVCGSSRRCWGTSAFMSKRMAGAPCTATYEHNYGSCQGLVDTDRTDASPLRYVSSRVLAGYGLDLGTVNSVKKTWIRAGTVSLGACSMSRHPTCCLDTRRASRKRANAGCMPAAVEITCGVVLFGVGKCRNDSSFRVVPRSDAGRSGCEPALGLRLRRLAAPPRPPCDLFFCVVVGSPCAS